MGSGTVMINGNLQRCIGDQVQTCADPVPNTSGQLIATGTVMIGG
jgi:uncharacterized Zn-binding protein involved in type VI secretion